MTDDLSSKTVCIVDNGLFVGLALKLAESFGRVLYFEEWETAFPTFDKATIGDGFKRVERCNDIWKVKNEVDCWIFPDIGRSGLQLELEQQGYPVWGSRNGDSIERNREKFMRLVEEAGLEVAPFIVIVGLTDLRKWLQTNEDKYIKISKFRGSLETFHWRSYREDSTELDLWALRFGPLQDLVRFLVFDAIETDLEIGGDTFCIDGQWPDLMLHGLECKDEGYLSSVTKRTDMPESIQDVMEAFGPILGKERYRNCWSMEIRVAGDKAFFIDGTARFGIPSWKSQSEAWSNFAEIIWAGAHGELVQPIPSCKHTAEVLLVAKGEEKTWRTVDFPEELRPWLSCGNCCEVDGRVCFSPEERFGDNIGWLLAKGDSIEQVTEQMKSHVKMLPDGVSACTESLYDLLKEAHSEEEQGIEFSQEKLPEPETALT